MNIFIKIINWFKSLFLKKQPIKKQANLLLEQVKKKPTKKLDIISLIKAEQERQKLKKQERIDEYFITKNINGLNFVFCKESYKRFKEEFNMPGWEVDYDISSIKNKGYLLRRNKDKTQYFHRWLMQDEIDNFVNKRKCDESNVEVHHRGINDLHSRRDNRLCNLKVMSVVEHEELHKKEKAFQKWVGSRTKFEEWWFKNNKEKRDKTTDSMINQKRLFN